MTFGAFKRDPAANTDRIGAWAGVRGGEQIASNSDTVRRDPQVLIAPVLTSAKVRFDVKLEFLAALAVQLGPVTGLRLTSADLAEQAISLLESADAPRPFTAGAVLRQAVRAADSRITHGSFAGPIGETFLAWQRTAGLDPYSLEEKSCADFFVLGFTVFLRAWCVGHAVPFENLDTMTVFDAFNEFPDRPRAAILREYQSSLDGRFTQELRGACAEYMRRMLNQN